MLLVSVKKNLKTILRDPITLLGIVIALIMYFMNGLNRYDYVNQIDVDGKASRIFDYAINLMLDAVGKPVFHLAFPFLGIIIAADLFRDRRTQSYDILTTGQFSFWKYYAAKLVSYYLVGLIMCLIITVSYEGLFTLKYHEAMAKWSSEGGLVWSQVISAQLVWMLSIYSSCLWLPIAFAVFGSALVGIPAVGVIVNCLYYYVPWMLPFYQYSVLHTYTHVIPMKMWVFLKYWVLYPYDWHTARMGSYFVLDYSATFAEAGISYLSQLAITIVLLTASVPLLKRRLARA